MDRMIRNVAGFALGCALAGSIAQCAEAHEGHILDHDEVSHPLYCAALYGHSAVSLFNVGDYTVSTEAGDRSNGALLLAQLAATENHHTDEQFEEAATRMFYEVGRLHPEDAFDFAEFLDCMGITQQFVN